MQVMLVALGASLLLGAVMTAGDWVWAFFDLRHRVYTGVAHGAVMCLFLGGVVGTRAGRPGAGLAAGPAIGVLAALAFYALAPALGYGAMLPAWMLFWILFAVLQAYLAGGTMAATLARGIAAAVLSGLAFYAISGIWTRPSRDPNYLRHLLYWAFAFLPGFLALFTGHPIRPRR